MTVDLLHKIIHLTARLKDDDGCDSSDSNCQMPVSQDLLTIGLAVGLPAAAVVLILSYFLFTNYRKNKKEDQEHDPDFDENGEATALPDFPPNSRYGRSLGMEDPFDNRNSIRYPPPHNYRNDDGTQSSNSSLVHGSTGRGEKYVESFVLPYHHQIGSKVSLDEYAKQLGEYRGAYGGTPRASAYVQSYNNHPGMGTRNSSASNLNFSSAPKSNSVSPQKSNLRYEQKQKYENIPNHSLTEIQDSTIISDDHDRDSDHDYHHDNNTINANETDDIEEISNDSDSFKHSAPNPKFEINYENESDLKVNNAYNPKKTSPSSNISDSHPFSDPIPDQPINESTESFNTTNDQFGGSMNNEESQSSNKPTLNKSFPRFSADLDQSRDENNASPFHDNAEILTGSKSLGINENDDHIDGDFDFSNDSGNLSAVNTVNNDHEGEQITANTSATNLDVSKNNIEDVDYNQQNDVISGNDQHIPTITTNSDNLTLDQENPNGGRKSPRISAFNLLKNDSDDEQEDVNEEYDEDKPIPHDKLSPEQEEELKRMKSVYKLYFDRDNSIKRKDSIKTSNEDGYEANYEFKADPDQPLPEVNVDQYLKVNKNLKVDTNYDKRLTTTSSIYTDHEDDFSTQQQQYNHYLQDQQFQQFYQQHVQSLPPLQSLPHPSDIRQSTIQTYTDYQPRSKGPGAMSPPMQKQPFNPIDNNDVWSPKLNNQATFGNGENSPNGGQVSPSVPSASQLARSSVVMLNPVTEITKQRKFKPAGSLPTAHNNNHAYAQNYGYPQSQQYPQQQYSQQQPMYHQPPNGQMYAHQQNSASSDLIPGGKKSDVRKMMNNNF